MFFIIAAGENRPELAKRLAGPETEDDVKKTFEQALIEQCAPTLAGVKPANLFRFISPRRAYVLSCVESWRRHLEPYGIQILILKECPLNGSFLIYLYRRKSMETLVSRPACASFLAGMGYPRPHQLDGLIARLSRRICDDREFPHEIGVFLGYPLCDVIGFIQNKGKNFTCSGYWKAYGNPTEARARFARYRKCTEIYKKLFAKGTPVMKLVC